MGYSISWCGIHATKESALEAFGFRDTGKIDEANEAPFSIAHLPSGWSIVWSNDFEFGTQGNIERLQLPTVAIACQVEEHVMFSACHATQHGRALWSVWHDSQRGPYDLRSSGQVPHEFETIAAKLCAEQDANGGGASQVDYLFDAPVELAKTLTGYRHDLWRFDWGEPSFTVIERPE